MLSEWIKFKLCFCVVRWIVKTDVLENNETFSHVTPIVFIDTYVLRIRWFKGVLLSKMTNVLNLKLFQTWMSSFLLFSTKEDISNNVGNQTLAIDFHSILYHVSQWLTWTVFQHFLTFQWDDKLLEHAWKHQSVWTVLKWKCHLQMYLEMFLIWKSPWSSQVFICSIMCFYYSHLVQELIC